MTIRNCIVVIWALAHICAVDSSAQRFIPARDIGIEQAIGSRLFPWTDGRFIFLGSNRETRRADIYKGDIAEGFTRVSPLASIPEKHVSLTCIDIGNGTCWYAAVDKVAYSENLEDWATVSLLEEGREFGPLHVVAIPDGRCAVTGNSYIVTQRDTIDGVVRTRTADQKGRVFVIDSGRYRLLAEFPGEHSSISNAIPIAGSEIAVALRTTSADPYWLAIIAGDGAIRYAEKPSQMPNGIGPTRIVRSGTGSIYAFYTGISGGVTIPPSFVIYDDVTGTTSWYELPEGYDQIIDAAPADPGVVACTWFATLWVRGSSVREHSILDGSNPAPLEVIGAMPLSDDSIAISTKTGIAVFPKTFMTTSVREQRTGSGIACRRSSNMVTFENITDGAVNTGWTVYDYSGRAMANGTTRPGETDITVRLSDSAQGLYFLELTANGRTVTVEPLLVFDD